MKSILCQINKQPVKAKYTSDELECFLDTIEYNVGDKILLVGHIGNLGKRLRGLGTSVTILENSNYEDVSYSLVYNENCKVVKGKLEFLPFDDNQFNKIIIVDQFNVITDCEKASSEIQRVLKGNGEVILEDLNLKNLKVKLNYLKHKFCSSVAKIHYPHEVFNIFSRLNFDGMIKESNKLKYIYVGKRR